jgi:hypothetical protein
MFIQAFSPEEDEIETDCMAANAKCANIQPSKYEKADTDQVAQD